MIELIVLSRNRLVFIKGKPNRNIKGLRAEIQKMFQSKDINYLEFWYERNVSDPEVGYYCFDVLSRYSRLYVEGALEVFEGEDE